MKLFSIFQKTNSKKYINLQNDILDSLGKSLKDAEFVKFIDNYNIKLEDNYSMNLFNCSNQFLQFQNRDQREQTINEINVLNNTSWLPCGLNPNDTLDIIKSKFGEPDICDYKYNALWYYDKLLIINFENIQDKNSIFKKLTFNVHLKIKPPIEQLTEINNANRKYLQDLENKSFGYNSKWIIIKSSDLNNICNYFGAAEITYWRLAFESSLSYQANGIFVTSIDKYGILVHGWALPEIDRNPDFYRKISSQFGETAYFANGYKTQFSWALFKEGELIRAYSEEYFQETMNLGQEINTEKERTEKRKDLLNKEEEYISDQDVKIDYRKFMSELVLTIAREWTFDPRELSEIKLEEKVYLNRSYR